MVIYLPSSILSLICSTYFLIWYNLIKIAVSALFIFALSVLLAWYAIDRRLANLSRRTFIIGKRSPKRFRGLILLVSQDETCRKAIQYHLPTLERCWLICSTKTLNLAEQIAKDYPHTCLESPIVINDIYDPIEFRNVITDIYTDRLPQGWIDKDIIADYTGMTASATAGMILSCISTDRPLQYTPAHIDPQTGTILGSLDPIEITLN
jgi:hypothetical protein